MFILISECSLKSLKVSRNIKMAEECPRIECNIRNANETLERKQIFTHTLHTDVLGQ